ncbi:hypothetical protein C8R45DRAFT_1138607 [Mycena sanguinolenta]|nr:hypothetical protein C8R45DRAFT_1138607 [Mycena sanguinolenta]
MRIDRPQDVQEILDGINGAAGLTSLVISTIKFLFAPGPTTIILQKNFGFLADILRFLRNLGNEGTLSPALIEAQGVIYIIAAAAGCLASNAGGSSEVPLAKLVLQCLDVLYPMISSHDAMRDALAGGLLQTILYCGMIPEVQHLDSEVLGLKCILKQTLPASTVYHSIIVEMEHQLQICKRHVGSPLFFNLVGPRLAYERIAFMKHLESKEIIRRKACHNTEARDLAASRVSNAEYLFQCGVIREKLRFRCCSRCRHAHYCSSGCQKIDWRQGVIATLVNPFVSLRASRCFFVRYPHLNTFVAENEDLGARNLPSCEHCCAKISRNADTRAKSPPSILYTSQSDPFTTVMDYEHDIPRMHIDLWSSMQEADPKQQLEQVQRAQCADEAQSRADGAPRNFVQDGISLWSKLTPLRLLMFPQFSDRPAFHEGFRRTLSARTDVEESIQQALTASVSKIH